MKKKCNCRFPLLFIYLTLLVLGLFSMNTGADEINTEVTADDGITIVHRVTDEEGNQTTVVASDGVTVTHEVKFPTKIQPLATPICDEYTKYVISSQQKYESEQGNTEVTLGKGISYSKTVSQKVTVSSNAEIGATVEVNALYAKLNLTGKVAIGKTRSVTVSDTINIKAPSKTSVYHIRWGQRRDLVKGYKEHRDKFGKISKSHLSMRVGYGDYIKATSG